MPEKKRRGFTLIEALISLVIVFIAVLTVARMLTAALSSYRHSRTTFHMMQELESLKNGFLAYPYQSEHWHEGAYSEDGGGFKRDWRIKNLSGSLKIMNLSLQDKRTRKKQQTWFYKSSTINNYSK